MAPWAKMYRKSFLDDHGLQFINYTMEDLHFNAVAYSKTEKIHMIDKICYNNFVNMESVTHTLHKGIRKDVDVLVVFDKIHHDLLANQISNSFSKSLTYTISYSQGDIQMLRPFLKNMTEL